jgi:hypothetical protein
MVDMVEMAVSLISKRLLEVIFNRAVGNGKSRTAAISRFPRPSPRR